MRKSVILKNNKRKDESDLIIGFKYFIKIDISKRIAEFILSKYYQYSFLIHQKLFQLI